MPKHREPIKTWFERYDQWRQARAISSRRKKKNKVADGEGLDWDDRGKRALAMQREHNLDVEMGRYLLREEVVAEWTKRVFSVRTRLLALPRTLGSRCANMAPDLVEREADQLVREMLSEFVSPGEHTPEGKRRDSSTELESPATRLPSQGGGS